MLEPTAIDEVQQAVRSCAALIPVGGHTKSALSAVDEGFERLSLSKLSGVVEYDPSEYTITVLAGTPLSEMQRALAEHGQQLPFDPPLAEAGATIGGTVAAGLSGPGAYRHGPIRDFLIGLRYVDGEGRLICGGGKVVKNAAGFDTPKFLVGSLGRFGVLVELSFKVFPVPEATTGFEFSNLSMARGGRLLARLAGEPLDLDALNFEPAEGSLWGRIAGREDAFAGRLQRIVEVIRSSAEPEAFAHEHGGYYWQRQLDFGWAPADRWLVKVPLSLSQLPVLDTLCRRFEMPRSYSMGGNVAWLAPQSLDEVEELAGGGLQGLVVRVPTGRGDPMPTPMVGALPEGEMIVLRKLKHAFDPAGRFADFSLPSHLTETLKSSPPALRESRH